VSICCDFRCERCEVLQLIHACSLAREQADDGPVL
jgi:hypothetical protein